MSHIHEAQAEELQSASRVWLKGIRRSEQLDVVVTDDDLVDMIIQLTLEKVGIVVIPRSDTTR